MKLPKGLLDPKGQAAKGWIMLEVNGVQAQEYGQTMDGNHSICYILAAPGDAISASIAVNSGVSAEFADLVVDGVLRNSSSNSRGAKVFRHNFDRAVYSGIQIGETKRGRTLGRMKIVQRDSANDRDKNGEKTTSKASSIVVQIFRKETSDEKRTESSGAGISQSESSRGNGSGDASGVNGIAGDAASSNLDVCARAPNFDKCRTWQDLNAEMDTEAAPSFEIGFFDGSKHYQQPAKRVREVYTSDFKLWTSSTFLLRSISELQCCDFETLPIHCGSTKRGLGELEIDEIQANEADGTAPSVLQPDLSEHVPLERERVDEHTSELGAMPKNPATKECSERTATTGQVTDPTISNDAVESRTITKPATVKPTAVSITEKGRGEAKTVVDAESPSATSTTDETRKSRDVEDPAFPNDFDRIDSNARTKAVSRNEDKEIETLEELIKRKKAELILHGVKTAPAHRAYLTRAATEKLEDEDDDLEVTPWDPKNRMPDILPQSTQIATAPQQSFSSPPIHMPGISSSLSLDLLKVCSGPSSQKVINSGPNDLPNSSFNISKLSEHARSTKEDSMPIMSCCVAPDCHNSGSTHSMPDSSNLLNPSIRSTLSSELCENCPPLPLKALKSQSTTIPDQNRQVYNIFSSPGLASASSPTKSQQTQLHLTNSLPYPFTTQNQLNSSDWNLASLLSIAPRNDSQTQISYLDLEAESDCGKSKNKLCRTSGLLSSEAMDISVGLPAQAGPQDMENQGVMTPSAPVHNSPQPELQFQQPKEDVETLGSLTVSSLATSVLRTKVAVEPNAQYLQDLRPSSPVPSEGITESLTEVASENALETSRKSSVEEVVDSDSNIPYTRDVQARVKAFHKTEASPILGSSQRLMAAHDTALMASVDNQNGAFVKSLAKSLMSPPPSAQKRKARDISGEHHETRAEPSKMSRVDNPHVLARYNSIMREAPEKSRLASDTQARIEPLLERTRRDTKATLLRKALVEDMRMELLARHQAALVVYKERQKFNQLKKEVDMMERANAELQATILALERGDDVAPSSMKLSSIRRRQ